MTTLNARANQAYHAVGEKWNREHPDWEWMGFDHQRDAFEEGWETGYKAARAEVAKQISEEILMYNQEWPRDTCPHGDPACPCPDGDMCHYEGPDPMSAPAGTGGLREALAEQAGIWEGYTSDNPDVATGFELAAGKLRYLLAAHPAAPAVPQPASEATPELTSRPVDREALRESISVMYGHLGLKEEEE